MSSEASHTQGRPYYGYATNGTLRMWTYFNGEDGAWRVFNNGANRLALTSAGNLGIGTETPLADVEIRPASGNADLLLRRADSTHGFNLGASGTTLFVSYSDGSTFDDHLTVKSTGEVGINTTSPDAMLEVAGEIKATSFISQNLGDIVTLDYASLTTANSFTFDVATDLEIDSGDLTLSTDDHTFMSSGGSMAIVATTALSITSPFFTVLNNGNTGVGVAPGAWKLAVNGSAAKPGGGSWSALSDERLKTDIRPMDDSLARMLSLRGVHFRYRTDAHTLTSPGQQMGFIAQEVDDVFPEWVERGDDGYLSVSIRGFEALTVEAIRELQDKMAREIETLQANNEELQTANQELHNRLDALETAVKSLMNE
jgi:hypothetical protein